MSLDRPPKSLLRGSSLFLDFDGTLVELASTPDAIEVDDEVKSLLRDLNVALAGRLAILSGRAVSDLRGHVHPVSLALGGSHGLERLLSSGGFDAAPPPPGLSSAVEEFRRIEAMYPGTLVEVKPAGVALHYRNDPEAEGVCLQTAQRMADLTGMSVQLGKMVVELRSPAGDKGRALEQFMNEPPFKGSRPVFVGDDLTDEHAFAAARLMGGAGVLVGAERPTAATYRLNDVADVRRWLHQAREVVQ